jgi:hypothetical protein
MVRESKRREHVHEFTKDDSSINLWGQQEVGPGFSKCSDSSNRIPSDSPERFFPALHLFSIPLPWPVLDIARNFSHLLLGSVDVELSRFLGQLHQQA